MFCNVQGVNEFVSKGTICLLSGLQSKFSTSSWKSYLSLTKILRPMPDMSHTVLRAGLALFDILLEHKQVITFAWPFHCHAALSVFLCMNCNNKGPPRKYFELTRSPGWVKIEQQASAKSWSSLLVFPFYWSKTHFKHGFAFSKSLFFLHTG